MKQESKSRENGISSGSPLWFRPALIVFAYGEFAEFESDSCFIVSSLPKIMRYLSQ